jgi:hypothetical protein
MKGPSNASLSLVGSGSRIFHVTAGTVSIARLTSRLIRIRFSKRDQTVDWSRQIRLSEAVWGCFSMVYCA